MKRTVIDQVTIGYFDCRPNHSEVRVYLTNGTCYQATFAGRDVTEEQAAAAFEQDRADRRLARNWNQV